MPDLGSAYVQIVPSAEGISSKIKSAMDPAAESAGQSAGKKSGSSFAKSMGKALATGAAVIGASVTLAAKKTWDMTTSMAAAGDEIDKMSQKVGLSYGAYQKWNYAMQISGTDMASCSAGLKTLTNTFDDAINGSKGATEKFTRLGLSMEDLKGLSREDLFAKVVESLQNVEDETEKAALANDMFGKSGQNLMPMFNLTNEELQALMQEAEDYGMVMGDDAVKASADFQDAMTKLNGTMSGVKNQIVGNLMPGFTELTGGFSDLIAGNEGAEKSIKNGITSIITNMSGTIPKMITLVSSIGMAVLQAAPGIITSLSQGILQALPTLAPVLFEVVSQIVTSFVALLPQLVTTGAEIIVSLISGITEGLPTLLGTIPDLITNLVDAFAQAFPMIVESGMELITSLVTGINDTLPVLIEMAPGIITTLIETLNTVIPTILDSGSDVIMSLIDGINEALPDLVDMAPDIITNLIQTLLDNLNKVIETGSELLQGIIDGLVKALPLLIQMLPGLVVQVVTTLLNNLPTLVQGAFNLFMGLVTGLTQMIPQLVAALPRIIREVVTGLATPMKNTFKELWSAVKNIFSPVASWFGTKFSEAWSKIKQKFSSWGTFWSGLWEKIKNKFTTIGTSISGAISNAVRSGINGVLSSIESIVNRAISIINGAIDLINKIPGVSVGHVGSLSLPRLAEGGVITTRTIAEIGEDGAEAIVPLENNTGWIREVAAEISTSGSSAVDIARAVKAALLGVTVELDDREVGMFVERQVANAVYA